MFSTPKTLNIKKNTSLLKLDETNEITVITLLIYLPAPNYMKQRIGNFGVKNAFKNFPMFLRPIKPEFLRGLISEMYLCFLTI